MIRFSQILSLLMLCSVFAQAQAIIWEENFDAAGTTLPAGWSQTTLASDGGWKIGSNTALSSQFFPILPSTGKIIATNDDGCNCNKSADIVKFPVIDLSTATKPFLLLDLYYYNATYQSRTERLFLQISEDGTTWTDLKEFEGGGDAWVTAAVSLVPWVGKSTVYLALRYNDGGGWLYGAAVDNVRVIEGDDILRVALAGSAISRLIDAVPTFRQYDKFFTGEEVYIRGEIISDSYDPITSFDATWTSGTTTHTQTFSGLNVNLGESYIFVFDSTLTLKDGPNDVRVTISNVNGVGDNDPSDNESESTMEGVSAVDGRRVIVEEGTGTWCTWCPRGHVLMDYMDEEYKESVITIAVHNQDPMVLTEYDNVISDQLAGYPGGVVDRFHVDVDPLEFEEFYVDRMTVEPIASISQEVAYDMATRKVTVDSKVTFLEDANGNFRISVVFTEDGVTGTSSDYAQINAYSGGGVGPMGGYEDLANPVPASQMIYNDVARAIVGGYSGVAGSVPATNLAGSEVTYTSTYTVPAAYNVDNMQAITLLLNNATGEVLNAVETPIPFTSVSSNTPENSVIGVSMAPNPVVESAVITLKLKETADVQLRIIDALGRTAIERNFTALNGDQYLPFNAGALANGTYMLVVTANGQSATKPFVVQR